MKFFSKFACVAAPLALVVAVPAAAQDAGATQRADETTLAAMAKMFAVEPLTAEQQARLPQATRIIDKMIPPGTMGEMMGSLFDGMMAPIMEMANSAPRGEVARQLGQPAEALDMSDQQLAEAADILDPVRGERNARVSQVMPRLMRGLMEVMEPSMRKAMTEVYAVHFSPRELADIEAFFSTESGLSFARKSFSMSADPRILAGTMEAMPAMMESFAGMEKQIADATADLPPERSYAQLSAADRARLSALTGMSQAELQSSMAAAAEARKRD
ncbi:MAG: DUF2059 domain-containing protein [Erythrobacter sp.]